MSWCFKYSIFRLTRSTKAHEDTSKSLPRSLCLWLSLSKRAKQQIFVSVLMYSICFASCASPLLLRSGALNPSRASQGSSRHMAKTGETCWRLPGCGPRSPDVRRHIVFKQTLPRRDKAFHSALLTSRVSLLEPLSVWQSLGTSVSTQCYRGALGATSSYATYLGELKLVWSVFIQQNLHLIRANK